MTVAESISECDCVKFSDCDWYKYSKTGATKARAVEELSRHLGIPFEEMAAFGDDYGDMEILIGLQTL